MSTAADVADIYELSPMQRGMLFHSLLAPDDGSYVEQVVLRLAGPLDAEAFWRAWQLLVDRHPALRTSVHWRDVSTPVQVVRRRAVLARDEHDWRGVPAAQARDRLQRMLDEERRTGFALESPPLMRLSVHRTGDEEHLVALRLSHLVVDGWSVGLLAAELVAAYRALHAGTAPVLAPAPAYRPYVEWWARRAGSADERLAFWTGELDGYRPLPPLASVPGGAGTATTEAGRLPHAVAEAPADGLAGALDAASRRLRVTRHTLVQAAWSLVLAAASGRDDVVAGTTFAHRPGEIAGVEGVVGCLLATVPVRVRTPAEAPVGAWLAQVQETITRVRNYLDTPLADVQQGVGVPDGAELVESLVECMNMPLPAVSFGETGLRLDGYEMDSRPHVPLTLVLPPDDLPPRLVHDVRRVPSVDAAALLAATVRVLDSATCSRCSARCRAWTRLCPTSRTRRTSRRRRFPRRPATALRGPVPRPTSPR
jgi:surfactin family lipopeptide synthetase C